MKSPMNRAYFLRMLGGIAASPLAACVEPTVPTLDDEDDEGPALRKSLAEWESLLTPERFHILFGGATEASGSSPLNDEWRTGTYVCAACFIPLFTSDTKYETGTGWPSFWQPIGERVKFKADVRFSVPAIEYHCFRCHGHQGHIFGDGPPPTGSRYCNNGLAVIFVPEFDPLPGLRS